MRDHLVLFCATILLTLLYTNPLPADIVFELGPNGGGGTGAAGTTVDGLASGTVTQSGVTATISANTGTLNQTGSNFGINAVGADTTAEIDLGDIVTLSFDQDVIFESVELDVFSAGEFALLNIAGTDFTLGDTGDGLDAFTFNNLVAAGQTVTLAVSPDNAGSSFSFESFEISVANVPEPSAIAVLALSSLGLFTRRRR